MGALSFGEMLNTILGTKKGMTQGFSEAGIRLPVTVVKTGPNLVVKIKNGENAERTILAYGDKKIKNIKKPILGILKGVPLSFLTEVAGEAKEGEWIKPSDVISLGDLVKVTGISKGKGFAGVVKRWRFAGGPKTHGQSDRERAPGSIGQGTTPGRVYKGKKMAGRMGGGKITVKNLEVISVDDQKGEIRLKGPVPGANGAFLRITKIGSALISN